MRRSWAARLVEVTTFSAVATLFTDCSGEPSATTSSTTAPAITMSSPDSSSLGTEGAPRGSAPAGENQAPQSTASQVRESTAPDRTLVEGATQETSSPNASDGSSAPPGDASAPGEPSSPLPPITIWLAGDSTVANGQTPCPRGWGGVFAPFFSDLVTVRNSAAGGRSVHTWLYNVLDQTDDKGECALERDASGAPTLQPRWQTMLDEMKRGDYLLIQFGINDGDPTCDRHVGLAAFKTAYQMMAEAARARGATPIFLTPVSSVACTGATARGSRGQFVTATTEAGTEAGVDVIDLHALSVALYQDRQFCPIAGGDVSAATGGPVGEFFCDDHTHFTAQGAPDIAALVAGAVRAQGLTLSRYLRD